MKVTVDLKHDGRDKDHRRIAMATRKFLLNKLNVRTFICTKEEADYIRRIRDDSLKRIRETRSGTMADFCENVLCADDKYFGVEIKVSKDAKDSKLTLLSK